LRISAVARAQGTGRADEDAGAAGAPVEQFLIRPQQLREAGRAGPLCSGTRMKLATRVDTCPEGRRQNLAAFFHVAGTDAKNREPILAASLKGNVSTLVANFIRVLNHNGRLDLLPAIAAAYQELLDRRAGRARVLVRSAVP